MDWNCVIAGARAVAPMGPEGTSEGSQTRGEKSVAVDRGRKGSSRGSSGWPDGCTRVGRPCRLVFQLPAGEGAGLAASAT